MEYDKELIYQEAKRKVKERYDSYISQKDKLDMITQMELMLIDPKQHLNKESIWIEMKNLTYNFLNT